MQALMKNTRTAQVAAALVGVAAVAAPSAAMAAQQTTAWSMPGWTPGDENGSRTYNQNADYDIMVQGDKGCTISRTIPAGWGRDYQIELKRHNGVWPDVGVGTKLFACDAKTQNQYGSQPPDQYFLRLAAISGWGGGGSAYLNASGAITVDF